MKKMQDAIMIIDNKNTRMAMLTTYDKLVAYTNIKHRNIDVLKKDDIIDFLKMYYTNKSKTTVANVISNLKYLFGYIGKTSVMEGVNLFSAYKFLSIKKNNYWTPNEIFEIIESIDNYQDKALILLCYLGLYDTHYKTIQNLKENDVHKEYIYANGKKVAITSYVSNILFRAMDEVENVSYTTNRVYQLKDKTGYLMRNKKSNKIEQDKMSVTCLKRKLQQIGEYLDLEEFTAVNIKNSRTIYDLVKLEYEFNDGLDINAVALKDYLKDNKIKGCLELLNVDKKSFKDRILADIVQNKDFYI